MAKPITPKRNQSPATVPSAPQPKPAGAASIDASSAINQLPVPQVRNATANSTLPPMTSTTGTDVIITSAIPTGESINVFWAIKGEEAAPVFSAVAQGTGSTGVEVPVPAWVIGFCIGQTLTIWYESASGDSARLELTVEVIDPQDMPSPEFLDLVFFQGSWWLDMTKFPGNALVELCAWPFIAAGQRLWVEAVGNEHLSPRRFQWVLEDHVVTAQEAQSGFCFLLDILREWLAGNEDWSSVTLHAGVTFNGAQGTPPEDPSISHIPANAHEIPRATANLRVGEPELNLLSPKLKEATYVEGQGYVVNPVNTTHGAHVVVTYDGMKPDDHVCVKFEGTPGQGSPLLACQDVQGGETSLVFPVPASAISANFNSSVVISYSVLRERLWPSQKLSVHVLAPVRLGEVDVEEKTDGKLCLNNFSGDATGVVSSWDYIAPGQTCWLWIEGKYEDGSPFHWPILTAEPVKREWVINGVSAPLARQELKKLADCQVFEVGFAVNFLGLADLTGAIAFRPLQLQIVQEDLVLLAPSVTEAVGSQLTVWNARDGATVRVEYKGMSAQHTITMCWQQADACLAIASKQGNPALGYVDFDIRREAVIHGIGKTVPIRYSVSSPCKQQTSSDLGLEISTPVRLPVPEVVESTNSVLDLRNFDGDARIAVAPWWFILPGQKGWLEAIGTGEDGLPYTSRVMIGQEVEAGDLDGLERFFDRAELLKFKNKTSLILRFKVTADGDANAGRAIAFPLSQDLLFTKKLLDITQFTDDDRNGWENGGGATDPRDLVIRVDPDGRKYLFDYGYTDTKDPKTQREKLVKNFVDLDAGRTYEFRADVRRGSGANPPPIAALTVNGTDIYPPTVVLSRTWITIKGTFTATSSTARLTIDNRQMGIAGNDIDFSEIFLEEK
ncbi:hypothetical protein ACQ9Y2_18735 [Pseudomonas palleroniana]